MENLINDQIAENSWEAFENECENNDDFRMMIICNFVPPEDHWRLKEGAEMELLIEAYDYLLDKDEEFTQTDPIGCAKWYATA